MSKNFPFQDCELLTMIVDSHKEIVECKITNAFHNHLKDETWMQIAKEFNSKCFGVKRTKSQLKNKYKHMKHFSKRSIIATGDETSNLESMPVIEYVRSMNELLPPTTSDENDHFDIIKTGQKESKNQEENAEDDSFIIEVPVSHTNELEEYLEPECITLHTSTPSTLKRSLRSSGIKRNVNVPEKSSDLVERTTKTKKFCKEEQESEQLKRLREEEHTQLLVFREEEHTQLLEFRKKEHAQAFKIKEKEHALREKEHALREEEHALQMKILSEKLLYFQRLNKNASFGDKDLL